MVTARRAGSSSRNRIRTGVAISQTELCAADIRLRNSTGRGWSSTLEPPAADAANWPSLASALADLARTLDVSTGSLAVSLMPPLTEVRRIDLPPVSADDMHRLLARNASRYFAHARGPQIVGALAAARQARGAPTSVIAAAAPARLIAAIRHAADLSGWTVEVLAPAEGTWAAAAATLWPSLARQCAWALLAHDDRTDLLQLKDGRLVGVRRFRAGAVDAAMIADTVGRAARIGLAGVSTPGRAVAAALSALGQSVTPPSDDWAAISEHPNLLAAHFAGTEAGPLLRAEDAVVLDRQRMRKATWLTATAAAALLIAAAFIELWGVHRQLRLVTEERARLRPQIASTLVGRTTVEATYRHVAALSAIERASPQWSSVIAAVSAAVPDGAHLTAIRVHDDSVIVDGLADRAARVFDGLKRSSVLIDVNAPAPVRRELQDNGAPLDHFTIAARVAHPSLSPSIAPVAVTSTPRLGQ